MTPEMIKDTVLQVLCGIAPEADPAQIEPGLSLREQLDLDSMDFLNFVIRLHEVLRVEIPEADYPRLATLDGCTGYLQAALAARAGR